MPWSEDHDDQDRSITDLEKVVCCLGILMQMHQESREPDTKAHMAVLFEMVHYIEFLLDGQLLRVFDLRYINVERWWEEVREQEEEDLARWDGSGSCFRRSEKEKGGSACGKGELSPVEGAVDIVLHEKGKKALRNVWEVPRRSLI